MLDRVTTNQHHKSPCGLAMRSCHNGAVKARIVQWQEAAQTPCMQSLSCILLVVERGERVHAGLAKALTLARHTRAHLELFLCETDSYLQASEPRLQRGHDYLRALRDGVLCADVVIDDEVAWAPSLLRGVAEKLRRTPVQMVVRVAGQLNSAMAIFARHLIGHSGIPLLLTRGRPWQAVPRFVAVLDPAPGAAARAPIGQLSELLKHCSGAQMDYLVSPTGGLAGLLAERNYDLITLALPPPPAADTDTDAGMARLLQATSADVLLAGTAPAASADARQPPQPLRSADRRPS